MTANASSIEWVDPATLAPDPGNPRTITDDARDRLRKLVKKFGLVENLVFNRRTGELVSGHQRRALALELGIDSVPVMFVDLPEGEARALAVALNNDSAQGVWEPELLAARLDELRSVDALELTAFDPEELASFGIVPDPEVEEVTFAATRGRDPAPGAPPDEPETEPGDVWELGDHRVVCADAFTFEVRGFNDGPVDLVVTDPPFAIFGSSTGVASDVADDSMVRPFFQALARASTRALRLYGHAYIHCDWRSWSALWQGVHSGGLAVRNMLVWDKGSGLGSNWQLYHELVAFAHHVPKASGTFDNTRRSTDFRAVYNAPNVIRVNRPAGGERHHHAAKPVALLESFVENSSDDGDTVLDLFAGSGSTLIAADNLSRRTIALDHDPAWCDVIVARWRELTGKRGRRRKGKALDYITED